MGFGTTERPCSTCGGKGVVVVTDKKTKAQSDHPCPACKGSGKSTGVVKK